MKMKEYKIGETFLIGRKKFQVVECNGLCEGCYFDEDFSDFCDYLQNDYVGSCYYKQREDAKNVCFKLIEE